MNGLSRVGYFYDLISSIMETIAQYGTFREAELLKMKLASCDIDAFIPDELIAGVAPHIFATRSGIRVQVTDKDLKMSKSLWLLR